MEANNMKAMREALKVIRGMVNEEMEDLKDVSDEVRADFISIRGWCDHALAAQPRNCDAGTPEEQTARYDKFCNTNRTVEKCCTDCPALGVADCKLAWAQMPYKKGATK